MRQVEDDAAPVRVTAEQFGHDGAVGTADVRHELPLGQDIAIEHPCSQAARHVRHGAGQQGGALRVLGQPLEEGLPVKGLRGGFPCPHRAQQPAERLIVRLHPVQRHVP
jgi:hypothetical protein